MQIREGTFSSYLPYYLIKVELREKTTVLFLFFLELRCYSARLLWHSGFWPSEIPKLLPREQLLRWKHKFVKNLKLFCNLSCQVLPMQWRAKFRILEMQKTIVWKRLNNKSLEYNVLIYWHANRNSIAGWLVVDCRRTLSRHCDCKCIWPNC